MNRLGLSPTSVPNRWRVDVDAHVSLAARGFGSVQACLWSDDGVLLGIASQTMVVRSVDTDGRSTRTAKRYA